MPPQDVTICETTAFVDLERFKVQPLTTKDDKAFHEWANKIIVQQPTIIRAYGDLLECWNHYHGEKVK